MSGKTTDLNHFSPTTQAKVSTTQAALQAISNVINIRKTEVPFASSVGCNLHKLLLKRVSVDVTYEILKEIEDSLVSSGIDNLVLDFPKTTIEPDLVAENYKIRLVFKEVNGSEQVYTFTGVL